jgi:hypothetical protein
MADIPHLFNSSQNKDDVLFRNILVGVLHSLQDRIYWYNTINNERTKVDVPVYFTVAGSERFLSDIFLNLAETDEAGLASGVYNKYPRAHVSLQSIAMQEEYLTNKFKRANYLREEDGETKQYNAEFIEAPFKLDFMVTLFVDSNIDMFKAIQAIFQNLYKNVYFYVDVFSVKVPCYFSLPADINKEKTMEFGLADKKQMELNFNIEVNATYPLFKDERSKQFDTSMFAGNRMEDIIQNLYTVKDIDDNTDSGGRDIKVTKDIWPSGNNQSDLPPE